MNLLNAPREAIEQIRNLPAARHLGSVENWSEEQFYAVLAHAYDLPFRRITMAERGIWADVPPATGSTTSIHTIWASRT